MRIAILFRLTALPTGVTLHGQASNLGFSRDSVSLGSQMADIVLSAGTDGPHAPQLSHEANKHFAQDRRL